MARSFLLTVLMQFAMTITGIGQVTTSPQASPNQLGPTARERLTQLHVPLTKDGLLSALHNENPEIRDLAIGELVADGVKEAAPEIASLMKAESEPLAKIALAVDLAQLGDERGTQNLQQYCSDTSALMVVRLQAADELRTYLSNKSCPGLVVQALQDRDSVVRELALTMIPDFKELSPSIVVVSLSDSDPSIRRKAAHILSSLGDAPAIPVLEAAINRETDPGVRTSMQRSLEALQDKQR